MKRSAPSPTDDPPFQGPKCEVCEVAERRYCCPACAALTCSLACCRAHKETSGCTGRRDRTSFKPTSEFGEQDLRSDFHLLEDINLGIDRAKRQRGRDALEGRLWSRAVPLQPTMNRDAPPPPDDTSVGLGPLGGAVGAAGQAKLVKAAAAHGTTLLLMPPGMSRRVANTSHAARHGIKWRVEFRFVGARSEGGAQGGGVAEATAAAEVAVDRASPEATWAALLHSALAVSSPGLQHGARRHADALRTTPTAPLRLLLLKEPGAANAPQYYALDLNHTVKESLAHKTIIEFPRVLVALPEQYDEYTLVPPRIEAVSE